MKYKINSIIDLNQKKEKIAVYVNNKSQFDIAIAMTSNSKFEYIILFATQIDMIIDIELAENIQVCINSRNFKCVVDGVSALITTVGHYNPVCPDFFFDIIEVCKREKIKIIEVPHGLFQVGYNLKDNSKIIDLTSMIYGIGCVESFADFQINWFDEVNSDIGYPKTLNVELFAEKCVPEYTVITTNCNWYLYDDFHQRDFYINLFKYISSNPDDIFILTPHSAELNSDDCMLKYIISSKPNNLFIYGITKEIYFYGIDNTENLIKHSARGITTVSTCLLDYEMFGIDVKVFSPKSTQPLTDSFESVSIFTKGQDIHTINYEKLKSGMLNKFNVNTFDEYVENIINLN